MPTVEERVDRLEFVLEEFVRSVGIEFNKLYNSQMRTEAELRKFKDEMREEGRKRNKEWSNLAKKMGTLVEDLIAPALRPVLSKYFNCDATMEGQRMRRRKEGDSYEIDAMAVCDDKVFMVEVKSTMRVNYIDEIVKKKERFFEFSPEHKGKELLVICGSITFEEDIIRYATKNGIYVMGWREWEYMDILNFDEISRT
jgi:hypothetical protein